jgi:hypothetical protein
MEVRQAEFARLCGASPSIITRKIKNKTLVRNAAGLLDTDNPVNARYIAKRRSKSGGDDTGSAGASGFLRKDLTSERMLSMPLGELVREFKGLEGLERYVKMLRDLKAAEEKEQKNAERRLRLIEKDFVTARLFAYQDSLAQQILEYPESAADELAALVLSKGSAARDEVCRKMEAGLSKILRDAKARVINELSGLKSKYQNEDDFEMRIEEKIEEKLEERSG